MYSGWADPVGPSLDAINYYERVQAAMGGRHIALVGRGNYDTRSQSASAVIIP
jgi:hypothetical protein